MRAAIRRHLKSADDAMAFGDLTLEEFVFATGNGKPVGTEGGEKH
jgi:hypothetical protein